MPATTDTSSQTQQDDTPTPAGFAETHGDPAGWSPADYETYENLSHLS
jgi:hypothetical protein